MTNCDKMMINEFENVNDNPTYLHEMIQELVSTLC